MIKNLTFGSDPEYYIINEKSGKIISSIPLVEGTKDYPTDLGNGFKILKDNILVEGNVPPTTDLDEFVGTLIELKERITNYLRDVSGFDFLSIVEDDCKIIDPLFLNHPEALEFGCSPYLNCWDRKEHRANCLADKSFRTAGFHIHLGYDRDENCSFNKDTMDLLIAKAFDLFLILPSYYTYFSPERFFNYGGLGQYRETSYGLECRSLGGYFLRHDLLLWVKSQIKKMIDFIKIEDNCINLLYLEKPEVKLTHDKVHIDFEIYNTLGINYENQILKKERTYVYI